MVDIWIKKKSPRDRGRWLVFVRGLPARGTYRAALLKLAGLGAALFHIAVATVPAESATSAPVRLPYSLAQYAVGMNGDIGKILGNLEQSVEDRKFGTIRKYPPRFPYRSVGEPGETVQYNPPSSPI